MVFNATDAVSKDFFRHYHGIDPEEEKIAEEHGIKLKIKFYKDNHTVIFAKFIFESQEDLNLYRMLGRIKETALIQCMVKKRWKL